MKIQCAYRQRLARETVKAKRAEKDSAFQSEVDQSLQEEAATKIQRVVRRKSSISASPTAASEPSQPEALEETKADASADVAAGTPQPLEETVNGDGADAEGVKTELKAQEATAAEQEKEVRPSSGGSNDSGEF